MAYLAKIRKKFNLSAVGVVEIRVELADDTVEPRVWLQCVPCEDEMLHHPARDIYECRGCGYEITKPEAAALAEQHVQALRRRFEMPDLNPKRGLLWRFLGLFANRKRLPAPKS
jgi:ribosomal protein L37AE/L43A